MTKAEKEAYKRFVKEAFTWCGMKIFMKDVILLETGCAGVYEGVLQFVNHKPIYIDYVMFEDRKTGKQYQVSADWTHGNLYTVNEYIA